MRNIQDVIEASADSRWAAALQGVGLHRKSVLPVNRYVDKLHELGFAVNAWETTYIHVLHGENPTLQWLKGTALRPLLDRLDENQKIAFLAEVGTRLTELYPPHGEVTLFPMPRVFFVAERA